jgi:maleate cis-trans isomerase
MQTGDLETMFEESVPKLKIGALKPLSVVDNAAYEFYRIAPPGVMLVMIPVGLGKFSKDDVERVFGPLDSYVDQLMERGVDLIFQSGVPLPLLIGIEAHDRLIERIEERSGKPATSSVLGVVAAAKRLGLRRIVLANKWSEPMNRTLGEFFARGGTEIAGVAAEVMGPDTFQKISTADHMTLAYELGRAALARHPDADGLYIGGGSWLSEPVCRALEEEFGRPAISNLSCMIWDTLTRLGHWRPIPGQGRLLAAD